MKARSFCKAIGGKGKLLSSLRPLFPPTFNRYFEPFLGGGSVFFDLEPANAFIGDANRHLINTYRVVRDDVESLIRALSTRTYDRTEFNHTRKLFNDGHGDDVWRAATYIYISKCGFNGLWRVNRSGGCNVPFGKYDNPKIWDAENLRACSSALRSAMVHGADFAWVEHHARRGDLLYADCPYVAASKTANFTSYTAEGFGPHDQVRLVEMLRRLANRGVHWVSSNSDTPLVRELYRGFKIVNLSRSGNVSCKGNGRQRVPEVAVLSGTWTREAVASKPTLLEAAP